MLYTSYFAKISELPEDIVPISISRKAPDGYKGLQYKKLAPEYDTLREWKENHDTEKYIKEYTEQVLNNLSINEVISDLYKLSDDKEFCLVCYEKSGDFCHRGLVSQWLNKNGFTCREYIYSR